MNIQELINQYNEVQAAQMARLAQLYNLLRVRKGWRFAKFTNGVMWSNCWDIVTPDLTKLNGTIGEVVQGDE